MKGHAVFTPLAGLGALLLAGCNPLPGASTPSALQPIIQYDKSDVSVVAGSVPGYLDGPAADAKFMSLRGLAIDASGSLFVADLLTVAGKSYHRLRKIDAGGTVSTFAGGESGLVEGPVAEARFNCPNGLAIGIDQRLYVSDSNNNCVRVVGTDKIVSTLAGGPQGYANGTGSEARFFLPGDMAADSQGNLFLGEMGNLRKISPSGVVATLVGGPNYLVGGALPGQFRLSPRGIGVDSQGNILVADAERAVVLKVSPAGEVSTLAGLADGRREHVDGPAAQARFHGPEDVAADANGNVYVADTDGTVRRISPAGTVTTMAGISYLAGSSPSEGEGSAVRIGQVTSLAVDASGSLFVTSGSRISRIRPL